jgi:hypothetical protein
MAAATSHSHESNVYEIRFTEVVTIKKTSAMMQ